ncbi:hypothetical protein SAMN06265338_101287 [Rhodoblastus acidophilus]|uniref:Uncharacterized protein n=1 Tax=Rhodoblastus acidophilus TaxID=1074 RepID=A0A212Q071_RHOAC|nr:hypothetical protein [Rhodoblastus acidophilus]PPQ36622.1 hypothetical protein CKO16_17345 [Rhodoblastus acidophilus]RAI20471.1 hypothetical protein CH337_09645 [Rhodoblastus acidophilus]SNB52588.1 hypothetical protein SAMN06265338_101287 [Rhodoblastus acidophilus]
MKKRKTKAAPPLAPVELANNFTRGLVATGLLAAIQNRAAGAPPNRKVAQLALQGGFALAAGVATADSLRRQDFFSAVLAVASGVAGVMVVETLLATETHDEPKEAEIG